MKIFIFVILGVFFSTISNAQWQDDVRLTFNPAQSTTDVKSVASEGSHIFTVWFDTRDGNVEVYYSHSSDYGETWGQNGRLTNNSSSSQSPMVLIANSEVFVFWYENEFNGQIKFSSSTDYGSTWSTAIGISNKSVRPATIRIAASNDNLYVTYLASGNQSLYLLRSTDLGKTWGSEVILAPDTSDHSQLFDSYICAEESIVAVTWKQNQYLYMVKSSDYGQTWSSRLQLTTNDFGSQKPSLCLDGNNIYLVYIGVGNIKDTLYATFVESPDLGETWVNQKRLSVISRASTQPLFIERSDSGLHLAWTDESKIHYLKSNDFGANWSSEMILSSNHNIGPSLSSNGKSLYLVWSDDRSGNSEVYFKKNPNANEIVTSSVKLSEISSIVSIQPSPASDMLTISIGDNHIHDVKIVDVNGRLVWSGNINGEAKIDIRSWASGVYIVQSDSKSELFIKQK